MKYKAILGKGSSAVKKVAVSVTVFTWKMVDGLINLEGEEEVFFGYKRGWEKDSEKRLDKYKKYY